MKWFQFEGLSELGPIRVTPVLESASLVRTMKPREIGGGFWADILNLLTTFMEQSRALWIRNLRPNQNQGQ